MDLLARVVLDAEACRDVYEAARRGDENGLRDATRPYQHLEAAPACYAGAMIVAAANGHVACMMIAAKELGATNFDDALYYAAKHSQMDAMRAAKTLGATNFNEALYYAAKHGQIDAMRTAKELGATNFNGALFTAATHGQTDCMRIAKELGAIRFDRALYAAAEHGQVASMRVAKTLSAHSIPGLNRNDNESLFARGFTLALDFMRVARMLTVANINSALIIAASHGQIICMRVAEELGATNFDGALRAAAEYGQTDCIRVAKEMGATEFHHPLAIAQKKGRTECVELLTFWIDRKWQHARLLDVSLSLWPLNIPIYVLLWILEWDAKGPLSEEVRVRLLEKVKTSAATLVKSRTN